MTQKELSSSTLSGKDLKNMARRKKSAKELQPNIKVRLDRRTVITVRDESKLAYWKEKFPGLEILEES